MAQFFLYFTQNGVFSGTKMQKQKILQNLLIRLKFNMMATLIMPKGPLFGLF